MTRQRPHTRRVRKTGKNFIAGRSKKKTGFLYNITTVPLRLGEDDEEYSALFGRKGTIHWRVYRNESGIVDGIYVNGISRNVGALDGSTLEVSKEESRGEGRDAINALFKLYPKAGYIFYADDSEFRDGTTFWERLGGVDDTVNRKDFYDYYRRRR